MEEALAWRQPLRLPRAGPRPCARGRTLPYRTTTVTDLRFWAQAFSSEPTAAGRSLPQLITVSRAAGTPLAIRSSLVLSVFAQRT